MKTQLFLLVCTAVIVGGCTDEGEFFGVDQGARGSVTHVDHGDIGLDRLASGVSVVLGGGGACDPDPQQGNVGRTVVLSGCMDEPGDPGDLGPGIDPCALLGSLVSSCESLNPVQTSILMGFFDHDDFRSSDPNCGRLKATMSQVLHTMEAGYAGTANGGAAGYSLYHIDNGPVAVWFHEDVFTSKYPLGERRRIVGHEAYHLADLDDDETRANDAANFCFGNSPFNPWTS